MLITTLALLLLIANAAPLLAGHWLPAKYLTAIDRGYHCADANPLLGPSKTWQGLAAALLFSAATAWLLQFSILAALLLALLAMVGDLLSSFIKRRLNYRSGLNVPGLDQLPESLLPMLGMYLLLPLSLLQTILPVLIFILLHIIATECLSILHWHPKRCR